MIHTASIDEEHRTADGTPKPIVWLEDAGYPVTVCNQHSVVSDSGSGYVVSEIETYGVDPEEADAVEDSIRVYVCHCADFVFRRMADPDEGDTPVDIRACKHVEKIDKSARARNDDQQKALVEGI